MEPKIEPISENELRRMYCDDGISTPEIAKLVGVSVSTVRKWMMAYNILRRTLSESLFVRLCIISKEDLCRMYCDENMSISEIAKAVGVSYTAVRNRMKKYDILFRTKSESHILLDIRGPNHPNWTGGPKKYCYKFDNRLREAVRDRDDYTCQNCGKTQEENGKKLSVHHVHYDAENCYPDLICLCHPCHISSNSNRDWWETHYMCILAGKGLLEWKPMWIE